MNKFYMAIFKFVAKIRYRGRKMYFTPLCFMVQKKDDPFCFQTIDYKCPWRSFNWVQEASWRLLVDGFRKKYKQLLTEENLEENIPLIDQMYEDYYKKAA